MRGLSLSDPAFVGGLMLGGGWEFIEETDCGSTNTWVPSYEVAVPPNAQPGDLMVMYAAIRANTVGRTLTTPAGWARRSYLNDHAHSTMALDWRLVDGSEPASYTWTFDSWVRARFRIMLFRGGGGVDPLAGDVTRANAAYVSSAEYHTPARPSEIPGGGVTMLWMWSLGAPADSPAPQTVDMTGYVDTGLTVQLVKLPVLRNSSGDTIWCKSFVFLEVVTPGQAGVNAAFLRSETGSTAMRVTSAAPRPS